MASTLLNGLKRELRFPSIRQAAAISFWIFVVGIVLSLLQIIVRPVIENRFAIDSISFPFAVSNAERAGSYTNLIGWGYFLNGYRIDSISWWWVESIVVLALAIGFGRVLWWGPVAMNGGAIANMLEWHFVGNVLDWIIIPNGAYGVRALSMGDIFIYGGLVPCVIALTLMVLRIPLSIWTAYGEAVRAGKVQP